MQIKDARWTPQINFLMIHCDCGRIFMHRADRWNVRCPQCGMLSSLALLREEYRLGRKPITCGCQE